MTLDIQFKIKNNPNYNRYIKEQSYWYKILNRNPYMFKKFEDEVKENYHLRASDRISRTLDAIEFIQNVVSNLK